MSQVQPVADHLTPRTALDLLKDDRHMGRLSFGCQVLDGRFRGGVPLHGITEFSGMAGSGKTQMMLHLLLQQQRPVEEGGLGGGKAFYLSTEGAGAFPSSRLAQMASLSTMPPSTRSCILDRIILHQASNVDEQVMILGSKLPELLADPQLDIRMVIVDSVSALFRGEYGVGKEDTLERAKVIFTMGKQMKKLSVEYGVPFIVTNQVSADFAASSSSNSAFGSSAVTPTLGLSWSTCVNHRFILSRRSTENCFGAGASVVDAPVMEAAGNSSGSGSGGVRRDGGFWEREMCVALSPSMPKGTRCRFVIDARGVHGEDDDQDMAAVMMGQ